MPIPERRRRGRSAPRRDGGRARRRVPGDVAEGTGPQQVIPVRVGGPARRRAQAALAEPAGERRQVGHAHRGVDEQAAAVVARDDGRSRGVCLRRRDEDARRHLIDPQPGGWISPTPLTRPPSGAGGRGRLRQWWRTAEVAVEEAARSGGATAARALDAGGAQRARRLAGTRLDARRDQVQAREERRQVVGGESAGPGEVGQRGLPRARRSRPGSCPAPARGAARRRPPGRCPGRAPGGRASGSGRRAWRSR